MTTPRPWLRRSVAWPSDHGSWALLLSPLIIGLVAGGRWTIPTVYLVLACLSAFLMRQPSTVAVKSLSGRRSGQDLPAAILWTSIYATIGACHLLGLVLRGYGFLLLLAIPGSLVYAWYLYLVSRRAERGQLLLSLMGAGVFALAAPAGLWAGLGHPDLLGWTLWGLTWAQSAASIAFVQMRLRQRRLEVEARRESRLALGWPPMAITTFNLALAAALGVGQAVSAWLFVAYLPQWLETLRGACRPALSHTATDIGLRQLAIFALYTLLFALLW